MAGRVARHAEILEPKFDPATTMAPTINSRAGGFVKVLGQAMSSETLGTLGMQQVQVRTTAHWTETLRQNRTEFALPRHETPRLLFHDPSNKQPRTLVFRAACDMAPVDSFVGRRHTPEGPRTETAELRLQRPGSGPSVVSPRM